MTSEKNIEFSIDPKWTQNLSKRILPIAMVAAVGSLFFFGWMFYNDLNDANFGKALILPICILGTAKFFIYAFSTTKLICTNQGVVIKAPGGIGFVGIPYSDIIKIIVNNDPKTTKIKEIRLISKGPGGLKIENYEKLPEILEIIKTNLERLKRNDIEYVHVGNSNFLKKI